MGDPRLIWWRTKKISPSVPQELIKPGGEADGDRGRMVDR